MKTILTQCEWWIRWFMWAQGSFALWPCPLSSALSVKQMVSIGIIILRVGLVFCQVSASLPHSLTSIPPSLPPSLPSSFLLSFFCVFVFPCLYSEFILMLAYFHLLALWTWNKLLGYLLCLHLCILTVWSWILTLSVLLHLVTLWA